MQIINELEPSCRGIYSGVYGYYDFEGQLNSAIAIRTMVLKDGQVTVQAGAVEALRNPTHNIHKKELYFI